MRIFKRQADEAQQKLFYQAPGAFSKFTERQTLRFCVGAALYMPATRPTVAEEILASKHPSLTTIILDLEDALGDAQVEQGIAQLVTTLETLQQKIEADEQLTEHMPLLFVRVRHYEQLVQVIEELGALQHVLTGYVLPKFTAENGRAMLAMIAGQNELGYHLYAMPILESAHILNKEQRMEHLLAIRALLIEYYQMILNVRVGSTDFCGLLGIRRSIHHTVYDVITVRECLADIYNVFQRSDYYFVVSGSVWEYFAPQFDLRSEAITGLLKEVEFDKLNGVIGKTIIHPTHIEAVNAMYVVTHEEFIDAQGILLNSDGQIGVQKSEYSNKMNEMKPHLLWAERILQRAQVYGVYNSGITHKHLLKRKVKQ